MPHQPLSHLATCGGEVGPWCHGDCADNRARVGGECGGNQARPTRLSPRPGRTKVRHQDQSPPLSLSLFLGTRQSFCHTRRPPQEGELTLGSLVPLGGVDRRAIHPPPSLFLLSRVDARRRPASLPEGDRIGATAVKENPGWENDISCQVALLLWLSALWAMWLV